MNLGYSYDSGNHQTVPIELAHQFPGDAKPSVTKFSDGNLMTMVNIGVATPQDWSLVKASILAVDHCWLVVQ